MFHLVDEPGVENTCSSWYPTSRRYFKHAFLKETCDFGLTRLFVLKFVLEEYSVLKEYTDVRGLTWSSSTTFRSVSGSGGVDDDRIVGFSVTFGLMVLSIDRFGVWHVEWFYRRRAERGITTGELKYAVLIVYGHELIRTFPTARLACIALAPD